MITKTLREVLCAAAVAALSVFGAPAHATIYDVGFDPPFSALSLMVIDVPFTPPCRNGGPQPCNFAVNSLDFFDPGGNEWGLTGPVTPSGSMVNYVGTTLLGIQVSLFNLQLISFVGDGPGCDGTQLSFALSGLVTFNCGGNPNDSGTGRITSITEVGRAPEPATLALLGLGLIGLAATRRRKLS